MCLSPRVHAEVVTQTDRPLGLVFPIDHISDFSSEGSRASDVTFCFHCLGEYVEREESHQEHKTRFQEALVGGAIAKAIHRKE